MTVPGIPRLVGQSLVESAALLMIDSLRMVMGRIMAVTAPFVKRWTMRQASALPGRASSSHRVNLVAGLVHRGDAPRASGDDARHSTVDPSFVTILFTDLVGSAALFDVHGDEVADGVRRAHFATLRHAVAEHGGREVPGSARSSAGHPTSRS